MRAILGITPGLLLIMFATASPALTPAHFWSQRFGSSLGTDIGYAVATDGSGNVFVTGFFSGTVNFGGGNLVSAAGSNDIFLAKYSATGVHQWSKRFGNTGLDVGYAVAIDGLGNVVVTGAFNGTVDFGGGNLVSASAGADIFVAKYDVNGVHQWSKRFGGTGTDVGYDLAVEGSGNLLLAGAYNGTVNFGGIDLVSVGGSTDIFVAKFDASGVHQWSKRFGSTLDDVGSAVAVDGSGNVVVTGNFYGTVNFGGSDLVSAGGTLDAFVAEFNASGTHQWSKRLGGTDNDAGNGVAVDGSGNVVVTGYFGTTVDFGGGNLTTAGAQDIFVAKYNSSGVYQWSKRFGSTSNDVGRAVAVDGSGNVVVAGYFNGTVDFGGGDFVVVGGQDAFLAEYNASGVHQFSRRLGSTSNDDGNGVAADGSGTVGVTGYFIGTVDFGGGDLVSGAGNIDIFVATYGYAAEKPFIVSIADVGNDQGKKVRIQFSASAHDAVGAATPVMRYEAYRRNDALPSAMGESPAGSLSREQLLNLGWVDAGSTQAHAEQGYLMDALTDVDSTIALGQYYSVFFVRAASAAPGTFYDSPIDSGYSLDNLAPAVPVALVYNAGDLSWSESSAADFDYFTVYGANSNSFGAATLVDYSIAPTLDVTASSYVYYFVTATDFSGNEGKPAVVNTFSGVGGTPTSYVLSLSAYPNPFNPETTVRYTLPAKGRVTIEVFDAHGAHVATLINEEKNAGAYTATWTGRDDRGISTGSGVYFARLTSPAGTRSYKMTLLK